MTKAEGRTEAAQGLPASVGTASCWENCSTSTCKKPQKTWSPLFRCIIAETVPWYVSKPSEKTVSRNSDKGFTY